MIGLINIAGSLPAPELPPDEESCTIVEVALAEVAGPFDDAEAVCMEDLAGVVDTASSVTVDVVALLARFTSVELVVALAVETTVALAVALLKRGAAQVDAAKSVTAMRRCILRSKRWIAQELRCLQYREGCNEGL